MGQRSETGEASLWRIDLARELASFYSGHESVRMIVLGGSPSRGLADRFSDLDVIVFWEELDRDWIEAGPLGGLRCERRAFMKSPSTDICLESWFFDTLKADFGHVTLAVWEQMTSQVLSDLSTDGDLQKSIQGFLDSTVLYGAELAGEWKRRLGGYPEGLGAEMVRSNLRFFVEGCLLNQGWRRGEYLFYYDGLCAMFRKLLAILSGLNGVYFTMEEPRWIESELERMPIRPDRMWERMCDALSGGGETGDRILEELIGEVTGLVREHMPELDLSVLERRHALRVVGCDGRPPIRQGD